MPLQIIDPTQYDGWDDLILSHPDYSFFHSSAWARVLFESYQYRPRYFTVIDHGQLLALIPVMEVNSFLTGRRGVSLPFTDYCNSIVDGSIQFQDLFEHIMDYGKNCRWKSIELRDGNNLLPSSFPSITYLGHVLSLSKKEDQIFSSFRDTTKRNIRKAFKEGVEVGISTSLDSVKEFCRLNCLTRREHGLPPQPLHFFKNLHDHVISKDLGWVVLASFQGKPIAGAIYFHFGKKAVYKYGASNKRFQHLRANNLVMWEAIKRYSQDGFKSLCFGRTGPENQGLIQFKSGWGTKTRQINYYLYDLKKGNVVKTSSRVSGFHNKIFKRMPIALLNLVGTSLYKHTG
jgi:hypothetical protein